MDAATIARLVEVAFLSLGLPLIAVGFRWARRIDRKVEDALYQFKRLNERLEEHDRHLEEVVKLVTSELGGNGVRDRLTRVEQKVEDFT